MNCGNTYLLGVMYDSARYVMLHMLMLEMTAQVIGKEPQRTGLRSLKDALQSPTSGLQTALAAHKLSTEARFQGLYM